jgi:hypothetical protein
VPEGAVVVRKEAKSANAFLEVYDGSRLRWRGMIPPYAGRPGVIAVAASMRSVTVRVARYGHPYIFAFDAGTGAKIDSFDLVPDAPADPAAYTLPTVATVSNGVHGAELLAAPGGAGTMVIGVALNERRLAWKKTIAGVPATDAWIIGDTLVVQAGPVRHAFALLDGADREPPTGDAPPHATNTAGGRTWTVAPRAITVMDSGTGHPMATIR